MTRNLLIDPKPLDQQIRQRVVRLLVILGLVQIVAMAVVSGFLSYRDAGNRALFLANSNRDSLGLMLSSGDMYGLKSQVKSFKSEDTPFVWIINKYQEDVTATDQMKIRKKPAIEDGNLIWKENGLFLKTSFPIIYHDNFLGTLVSLNRLKYFDVMTLSLVFILVMSIMFFIQSRSLEKFALKLGAGIRGLAQYFAHSNTADDLDSFQINRESTVFSEVEDIATQTHKMLRKLLHAAEVELDREKYKAIAQVTAHVAHDLRHPLTVFASLQKAKDWDEFVALKADLPAALQRIENMIDGLRHSDTELLVRLSPGVLLASDLVNGIRPTAKERNILVRYEGDAPELKLSMDHGKLHRALYNILFNALESSATEVVLRSNSSDEGYLIEIADNGPGVPEHFIDKLFAHGSTLGKQSGSGLGLSFCKKVIALHGGSIRYERRQGETTFIIHLNKLEVQTQPHKLAASESPSDTSNVLREPCRIFVRLVDAERQASVINALIAFGHITVNPAAEPRRSDLMCSDIEEFIHLGLTHQTAVIFYDRTASIESTVQSVLKRFELMERAREGGSHEAKVEG